MRLLDASRTRVVTEEDLREQRVSFAFGNAPASSELITKESVRWRLDWIHPFVEGNGRTARAACYYLLCLKQGQLLPGSKIVPELIGEDRRPYYEALRAADIAWEQGHFDVSVLAEYLSDLLKQQLSDPSDSN